MTRPNLFTTWLVATVAILLLAPVAFGTNNLRAPFIESENPPTVQEYFAQVRGESLTLFQSDDKGDKGVSFDINGDKNGKSGKSGRKSGTRAFLYSLAIPGLGQLYTGSKIKAAAFFGAEALCWAGYISYDSKGNDKTAIFEDYANTHWSQGRYEDYLYTNWQVRDDDSVYRNPGDPSSFYFTHHLPDTKTQQYFEMIGKYNQFVFGWDDVDPLTSPDEDAHEDKYSGRRMIYEDMRYDANKMYDRASTALKVMMANHLISAFWAALDAKRYNDNADSFAARMTVRAIVAKSDRGRYPMLTMSYKF